MGEALDERPAARSARALGDIAHHFAAAAPIGGPDRAVEYALLAAAAAMAALAFDEAAARFCDGARARDPADPRRAPTRCSTSAP